MSNPRRQYLPVALACLLALLSVSARAQDGANMIGRQSNNVGVVVVPAPGKVTIDGKLNDWDWSGRDWVFADKAVRNRFSVEVAAMWDKQNLYLAAKWRDPTPMFSTVNPKFNPNDGWKSDSWQIRLRTDRTSWFTTWYFTPEKMPVLHVDYWKDENNARGKHDVFVLTAQPGGTELGRGVEMAYRETEDGKGFVQEMKLPWTILYRTMPDVRPGMQFQSGMEFLWGDPTGKTWPIHRYADIMAPGQTSREFFWTAVRAWGFATLVAKGNVPVRQYVDEAAKLPGTLPVRATIPARAARFTIAINDAQGRRVRSLAGDFVPEDYAVGDAPSAAGTRGVEVMWDGLDDQGRLVKPGTYQAVGLTHEGLGSEYVMCFYNPGTPPWGVRNGSGGWGADHADPSLAARAGDWMIVAWPFAEGGSGIIGVGPDGLKKWGEKRGATALAADKDYVYAVVNTWRTAGKLCRFARKDGSYKPFIADGKALPFELDLSKIVKDSRVVSMAAHDGKLVLSTPAGLEVLDAATAKLLKSIEVPAPGAVALGAKGACCVVPNGAVQAVDLTTGKLTPVPTPGAKQISAITVDNDGNLVVSDVGPDSQVKAYTPAGKLVYTCGRKGGRPLRGKFDEQAMVKMNSVAVDSKGDVWVVERWPYPRRVSVWGRDGRLVRAYIGNTGYAGTGSYLHDQDPTLGYVGPIEIKLNEKDRTWKVTQILWVPDKSKGESFLISTQTHALPQRFRGDASGAMHEYLYTHPYDSQEGHVVFMERGGKWQPVTAICLVGHISGQIGHGGQVIEAPSGEFAGLNAYDGCYWNDTNRDGKVQLAECTIVKTDRPAKLGQRGSSPLPLGSGWGGRIGRDFVFYVNGLTCYKPLGFTDDGAPMYGPGSRTDLPLDERGDLVPVPREHLLLCLSFKGYAGPTTGMLGIDERTSKILWAYPNPYPGVHGSHRAIMPKPGLLIGPLKITGVADVNDTVGRVFLMRGNLGQDFFMTTDGLYVGTMFEDGRLPGESLPAKESELIGRPMETFSNGGEPFNGWFGKQSDGRIRMTTGFARQACMILEVKGLDSIRRFRGPSVSVDAAQLVKAAQDNSLRAAARALPKSYTITRVAQAPRINGDPSEWRKVAGMAIKKPRSPFGGTAKLAWDDRNLYVLFEVKDDSPWRNEGKDFTRLFKTGDAVDLQLNTDPSMTSKKGRRGLVPSDLRIVFATLNKKPVAVLMRPIEKGAPADERVRYHSPVGDKVFDRMAVLVSAQVAVKARGGHYCLEAAIPLSAIGLTPKPGMALRGDVGITASDAAGTMNVARLYWANPDTNLVNDLPHESWLFPYAWGTFKIE